MESYLISVLLGAIPQVVIVTLLAIGLYFLINRFKFCRENEFIQGLRSELKSIWALTIVIILLIDSASSQRTYKHTVYDVQGEALSLKDSLKSPDYIRPELDNISRPLPTVSEEDLEQILNYNKEEKQ